MLDIAVTFFYHPIYMIIAQVSLGKMFKICLFVEPSRCSMLCCVFIKGSVSCFSGNRPCVCILHSFYTNCCILQQHLVSGWASIERNISISILFLKNKDLITAKHIKNNFNQVLLHWQVLSGSLCRVVCHREELCWRTSELTSDTQLYHSSEICQCLEEEDDERSTSR